MLQLALGKTFFKNKNYRKIVYFIFWKRNTIKKEKKVTNKQTKRPKKSKPRKKNFTEEKNKNEIKTKLKI